MKLLLEKALAGFRWVWTAVSTKIDDTFDLKPTTYKVAFWVVLGTMVTGYVTFNLLENRLQRLLGLEGPIKVQTFVMPRLPSVVTTVPLPATPLPVIAPVPEIKPDAKVAPVTTNKAPKAKRKAKKEATNNILGF